MMKPTHGNEQHKEMTSQVYSHAAVVEKRSWVFAWCIIFLIETVAVLLLYFGWIIILADVVFASPDY